jgi:uncharacterized repeat protein (TIGR01451 family)/fimbrial isopeptide formation D2 family protein
VAILASVLVVVTAEPAAAQPAPSVTIDPAPVTGLLGEPVSVTLTFDNTGAAPTDVGYAPYIDLRLPAAGADGAGAEVDDGLTFVSASHLGTSVSATTIPCPDGGGTVTHPLHDGLVDCPDGVELTVIQIPFGSFAPGQVPAEVVVTLDGSELADIDVPLTFSATPGFAFGDSPTGTTPIIGAPATTTYTPIPLEFTKEYVGPEDETATGPNFPRTYRLVVDVPEGQTVTDVVVSDLLPPQLAYNGIVSVEPASGLVDVEPPEGVPSNPPDNELSVSFASITGTAGAEDVVVAFEFFVPELDADGAPVLDPATGAPVPVRNDGAVGGTFDPIDDRDPPEDFTIDPEDASLDDHILTARSIAVQKTGANLDPDGDLEPGDRVEYRLRFQISDFFTFDDVVLTDILGDGLEVDPATARFGLIEHNVPTIGTFTQGVDLIVDESQHACGDGSTTLDFLLSDALADGTLEGGRVGGTFSGTEGVIVFEATVLDEYRCAAGEPALDPGDTVTNDVTIEGTIPGGGTPTDGSGADLVIAETVISKDIVARNGEPLEPSDEPPHFGPGDTITFRFQVPLGSTDMESLTFTDFFPLPVIQVTGPPAVINEVCGIPDAGTVCLGPDDTFHSLPQSPVPVITADPAGNSITVDYGSFESPGNPATLIDVLATAIIQDDPFRDQLLLVNELAAQWQNTDGQPFTAVDTAPFIVNAPQLRVTKGVVGSSNPDTVFTGGPQQPAGPAQFAGPGATCPDHIVGGTLTSANLAGAPDADAELVDAGDIVRFAFAVENTGFGPNGAFDVTLGDEIPDGFQVPAGGLNLCVTDGTGAEFEIEASDGMFEAGPGTAGPLPGTLTLADPGPTDSPAGALDPPSADFSTGRDLVVVSYELEASPDFVQLTEATNTVTIDNFSADEDGPNYVPVQPAADITDDATVTPRAPAVAKTLVETDQPHTSDPNVVVGEAAQYQVVITVPEGTLADATLVDTLPAGLTVVGVDGITASGSVATSVAGGFDAVADNAQGDLAPPGQTVTFDFSTLTNSDTDDAVDETITILYSVVVLDVAENQEGLNLQNDAVFSFNGRSVPVGRATVTVREPDLQITKTPSPAVADAGDTVTYTITIANLSPSTVDAFDVTLEDLVPAPLAYVDGSFRLVSGPTPTTILDGAAPTLTATWDVLALGAEAQLQYEVTVPDDVTVPSVFPNTAETCWTSLPADDVDPISEFNPDSHERTGGGGVDDYCRSVTANLRIGGAVLDKAVNATSAAHTTDPNVTIGEVITYDVRATLPEGTATNVVITDVLPVGLQYVPGTVQILTTAGSGTPPFTLAGDFNGTLPPFVVTGGAADGDDVVVTFPGTSTNPPDDDPDNDGIVLRLQATVLDVPSNVGVAPQTVLVNQATIAADGAAPVPSNQTANPVVEPQLDVTKTAAPTQAEQGDTITLTIDVTNTGTSTAFEVLVTDDLPAEYDAATVVEVTTPAGFDFSQAGSVITYQGGDIPAGETVTFVITVDLVDDLPVGAQVTNTATASEASTLPGTVPGERTEPPDSDTATVNLVDADLVLTKTDNDTVVAPGDTQVYDLVISNVGGATATNVTVTDTLPPSTTFVSVGGTSCTLDSQAGQTITIDIAGDIPAGGSVTCTLTLTIDDPLPAGVTTFTNVADVTYDGDEDDPSPDNNHAEDTDTKDPAATPDLEVVKDDGETEVAPGQALTYEVTVTNVGSVGATNVLVTDTIPPDTTFVACTTEPDVGCVFNPVTRRVTATFPEIDGGDSVSMFIDVVVNNPLPAGVDDIVNTVTVVDDGANGPDPTPENNTDTDTDTVDAAPDMAIVKTAGADLVVPGQTYGYTLRVTNIGDQEASGVVVTDVVPPGLTVDCASVTPAASACDQATGTLRWGPGAPLPDPFPRAAIVTLTYQVTVDNPAEAGTTTFPNTAVVADDGTNDVDPTPANNTSSAETSLDPDETFPDLSVVKDDGLTVVTPGQSVTYSVTVTNTGNIGASSVLVTDTLPPNTTYVSCTTVPVVNCTAAGGVVTATFPVLAGGGGQATLSITMTVDNPQPAGVEELTNVVTVEDDGTNGDDPTPDNNRDTDTDELEAAPDLTVVKDDGVLLVQPGQSTTYTITASNVGTQDATGVVVTDTLPPNTTFVACTGPPDCVASGQTVTWTFAEFPVGTTVTLGVTVEVDDPLPAGIAALVNRVTVADDGANGPDPTPEDNADSDIDIVQASRDLELTKDDGLTVVTTGQTATYTITVTNVGNQAAAGVTVTDTLPAELEFVSCTPACDSSALPTVTWNLGTVAGGGATVSLTLVATIVDPAPAGAEEITNPATVDDATPGPDPTPENNTDTDTDTLDAAPDMAILKEADDDLVVPGQTYEYTLTVTNVGDQEATGVAVTDDVPDGLIVDCASTAPAATACDPATGALQWGPPLAPDPFPPGANATITYEVTVIDPAAAGTMAFPNTAVVSRDETDDPDPTDNNESSEETSLDPAQTFPDLSVVKDDGLLVVTPGQTVTYSVTVTNSGNIGATNVLVTDTLPSDTTFVSCSTVPVVSCTAAGGVVTATFPVLAGGGGQATLAITMTVDDPQPAGVNGITNVVTVEDDGTNGDDPTPDNNTDSDTDILEAAPDLTVVKNNGVQLRDPGDRYTYTITVSNVGNQGATGVTVTDTLPTATTFVSCTPVDCVVSGQTVTWTIAELPAGESVVVTVTVDVPDPLPPIVFFLLNGVTVADDGANGPDPTPENNTDFDLDLVTGAPDLVVTKDDGVDVVAPGDTVTYTITVTNVGDQDAPDVVVTDVLPPELTFISCDPACDSSDLPTVTWDLGVLSGEGGEVTLELTVAVVDPMPAGVDEITNPAAAVPGGLFPCPGPLCADLNPANNIDTDTDTVDALPDMVIDKVPSVDRVDGGGTVTYTLTVTNAGDQDATGVIVTDAVPAGMTVDCASTTPAATACDPASGAIEWGPPLSPSGETDPWPAGESATFSYTVTVADPVPSGTTSFVNTATAADDGENGEDPTPENNTDTATVDVQTTTVIDKRGPDQAETGDVITYTMVVTNVGHSEATGVTVTDPVPAGLVFVSGSGTGWTCSGTTTVTCRLAGPLPAGASSTLQLRFRVTAADRSTIVNVAEVSNDGCNCDTDDATTRIVDPPARSLSSTGFVLAGLVPLALGLVVIGTGLTIATRDRKHRRSSSAS